jgi:acyl-coenzyme A synthetase/AMP-(fatty) acid ligase
VAPAELEDILVSHSRVKEAAVCGVFDEVRQTEIPVGYVNLQDLPSGMAISEVLKDINSFVDEKVSAHKRLRGGVHFLAEIPRNINGKLVRRLLPAKVEEERKSRLRSSRL